MTIASFSRSLSPGYCRIQGLTELFFESAEPQFESDDPDDVTLTPDQFFARFPEGKYRISGETLEGESLRSKAQVTHLMPAPAGEISVGGEPVDPETVDCDEGFPPVVMAMVMETVSISWGEVTLSHSDLGSPQASPAIQIHNYEVVVEVETGSGQGLVFGAKLPPDTTTIEVPATYLALDADGQIKFEILARERSFSQTAVESCFIVMLF